MTPVHDRDVLSAMFTIGVTPENVAHPAVAPDKTLITGEHEEVIYRGSHRVTSWTFDMSGKGKWRSNESLAKPADVLVTEQRIAWVWPNWKSDRSGGSVLERRVMSRLIEREEGPQIIGGQIAANWLSYLVVTKADWRGRARLLAAVVTDAASVHRLDLGGFVHARATTLAAALARAAAQQRVDSAQLAPEDRTVLDAIIADGEPTTTRDWGVEWLLPGMARHGR